MHISDAQQKSTHDSISLEAIQSCGCLLRFDAEMTSVQQVSDNIEDVIGIELETALQSTPHDLLGSKLLARLEKALANRPRLATAAVINRQVAGSYQRFYVMAYRSSDSIVVEIEPLSRAGEQRLMPLANEWLSRLAVVDDIQTLQQMLVQGVQAVSGFDRVLLGQFDGQGHRTVVAQAYRDSQHSLLNARLPANALSEMLRQGYQVNPLRSVPNINSKPAALIPAAKTLSLPVLDLSAGMLHVVSASEWHYLNAIQVSSNLSIAIHDEKGVWGVLTCHGFGASEITPAERDAAYNLALMATQRLFLLKSREQALFAQTVLEYREFLFTDRDRVIQPGDLLTFYGKAWLQLFNCQGIALHYNEQYRCFGETLSADTLARVCQWLSTECNEQKYWSSATLYQTPLHELIDGLDCAGLLAVALPLSENEQGWLLLFRKAQPQKVRWIGTKEVIAKITANPLHAIEDQAINGWLEQVENQALPWSKSIRHAAQDFAADLTVVISIYQINRLNIQLQRANSQLEEIAHTDTLTKAWNRYRMEQAIDAELAAAIRHEHPCSILLFDIDNFKRVNDDFGHDAGDRVLTKMAHEVQIMLRASDFLGRWGGEEFVILVPHNTLQDAEQLANRLREHIASLQFDEVGQITISIGVAQLSEKEHSRRQFLERADRAMYQAKQAGRDQVKLAPM